MPAPSQSLLPGSWDPLIYIHIFYPLKKYVYIFKATLCGMGDLSSPTGDQTHAPYIGSLNHWTTREVPKNILITGKLQDGILVPLPLSPGLDLCL